jgi:hypothetical protein
MKQILSSAEFEFKGKKVFKLKWRNKCGKLQTKRVYIKNGNGSSMNSISEPGPSVNKKFVNFN